MCLAHLILYVNAKKSKLYCKTFITLFGVYLSVHLLLKYMQKHLLESCIILTFYEKSFHVLYHRDVTFLAFRRESITGFYFMMFGFHIDKDILGNIEYTSIVCLCGKSSN